MTAQDFIAKYGVTMTATPAASNPNMDDDKWKADHWTVTIKRDGRQMSTSYSTGLGRRRALRNCQLSESQRWSKGDRIPTLRRTFYNDKFLAHNFGPVAPDLSTVLESLAMDVSCAETTFHDWCSVCGYNTDSRKALAMYLACQQIATDLRHTLGASAMADLSNVEW